MRLLIIFQFLKHHVLNAVHAVGILYRNHQFYTIIKVSRHPVSTANVQFFTAAIIKPEHTAMFKETPYQAANRNIIAHPWNSRNKHTDTTDNEFNLYPCLRSFIEFIHHTAVQQRIHLGNNMPIFPILNMLNFSVNQGYTAFAQIDRCHKEGIPYRRIRISGQKIEECRRIRTKCITAGKYPQIGIQFCCRRVIVTGSYMNVSPDAILFPADNQCTLRVSLQPYQPINYVSSRLFKASGHVNIVFFIKTGLNFHENRDLLTILRRFFQCPDNRAPGTYTVQCLFNRQYIRIRSR